MSNINVNININININIIKVVNLISKIEYQVLFPKYWYFWSVRLY